MVDLKFGLPLAAHITNASSHESQHVSCTVLQKWSKTPIKTIVGDRAYDSNPARDELWDDFMIDLIAPKRKNKIDITETENAKIMIRQRYKIERFHSWIQAYKKVVIRMEYYSDYFLSIVQAACAHMRLKQIHFSKFIA